MTEIIDISPVANLWTVWITVNGNLDIIPPNIISDIPFPIPFSVICSPNHIRKAVPAVKVNTTTAIEKKSVFINALLNNPTLTPIAWINASTTVKYLVNCAIFLLPASPCLANSSKAGIAMVKRFKIIDAVI